MAISNHDRFTPLDNDDRFNPALLHLRKAARAAFYLNQQGLLSLNAHCRIEMAINKAVSDIQTAVRKQMELRNNG